MIIESIHINSFGKLHDLDMAFDPHLNLIEGANESGKSTLAAFLRFMLYGFSRDHTDEVPEDIRRIPWNGNTAGGSMLLSAKGKHYRVDRSITLQEDGSFDESQSITDLDTGREVFPRLSAGQALLEMPPALFDRTAFVGRLSDTSDAGLPLAEAIENLIFSGDEKIDTARALSELSEAKNSLLHIGGKGGVIATLRQKEEELSRRLTIARTEQAAILKKEAALVDTRRKKEEAKREEASCIQIENDYKNAVLIQSYDYMHELEESQAAIEKDIAALRAPDCLDGFPPTEDTYTRLSVFRENEERLRTAKTAAAAHFDEVLKKDPATREERKRILLLENSGGAEYVSEEGRTHAFHFLLFLVLSICAVAVAILTLILDLAVFSIPYAAMTSPAVAAILVKLVLLSIGGILFFFSLRAKKKKEKLFSNYGVASVAELGSTLYELEKKHDIIIGRENELAAARREIEKNTDSYLDAFESAAKYLMTGGVSLPEDNAAAVLSETAERVRKHLDKIAALEAKKAGVGSVIRELRATLGDRNEVQIRATVAPADRERLTALSHRELLDSIEHYERLYRFYDDKERELVRQITAGRQQAEDPYLLESEGAAVREQLTRLFCRHSAYDLAENAIRTAGERLRTEISPRLTNYACRLMETATDGKYTTLGVDKNIDLHFTENEVSRKTAFLSSGTRDIAYFSLRMALVDLLYSEAPPLFFDESFAHQDTHRVTGAFRALRLLSEEGKQIFVFTCHERDLSVTHDIFPDTKPIRLSH